MAQVQWWSIKGIGGEEVKGRRDQMLSELSLATRLLVHVVTLCKSESGISFLRYFTIFHQNLSKQVSKSMVEKLLEASPCPCEGLGGSPVRRCWIQQEYQEVRVKRKKMFRGGDGGMSRVDVCTLLYTEQTPSESRLGRPGNSTWSVVT